MKLLFIMYAAAIFSVATWGGLLALRRMVIPVQRAVFFVILCVILARGTFWLSGRWSLDPVDLGIAWAIALLLVGGVEVIRVRLIKQSPV
jgi:hypothetical protein